jgi:hypothetical protein
MSKNSLTVAACAALLWAGTALAQTTPQHKCDRARITAWKKYVSCIEGVVAKDAKGVGFDEFKAFAKCRHTYFKKWTGFQTNKYLKGSTCRNDTSDLARFADNGDGTVTDRLTTLVWEKKTTDSSVHDEGNEHSWSTADPWAESGTAFTSFLSAGLNGGGGFAGANDWRLPTLAELQTIVQDFPCTRGSCSCGSDPCIDVTFSSTQSYFYWSSTTRQPGPDYAWIVHFGFGEVGHSSKFTTHFVRAVRGGL